MGQNIKVMCDNSTAISYVNKIGIVSGKCNSVNFHIWEWCVQHGIWFLCLHIAGTLNSEADRELRVVEDNLE